nr:MAG TPA: hypothetical protein [Caudoviricetes sp.]
MSSNVNQITRFDLVCVLPLNHRQFLYSSAFQPHCHLS